MGVSLALFTGVLFFFAGLFWLQDKNAVKVSLSQEYFFLVQTCEENTSSVVAGQIYSSGGAGVVVEKNAVALACYFSRKDALSVQERMEEKGVFTQIFSRSTGEIRLKGKDRGQGKLVRANAQTAESCAKLLYQTANGLENLSLSQEQARVAVDGVFRSLKGLREGNGAYFSKWNERLKEVEEGAKTLSTQILFSKDLRRLQAKLCAMLGEMGAYF